MSWVEDELRGQQNEKYAAQNRVTSEAAAKAEAVRLKELEHERISLGLEQKSATAKVELPEMLTARNVEQLLRDVQGITGGDIVSRNITLYPGVNYAALGLVNTRFDTSVYYEGGGYTHRWSSGNMSREDTGYIGSGSKYIPRFKYRSSPFKMWILGIGIHRASDTDSIQLIARNGTSGIMQNFLKDGLTERILAGLGKGGEIGPEFKLGIDQAKLFTAYAYGVPYVHPITSSGAINLDAVNLTPISDNSIIATRDLARDQNGIRELLINGLGIIKPVNF